MKKEKILPIVLVGLLIVVFIVACFVGGDNSGSSKAESKKSEDPEVILANAEAESKKITDEEKKDFVEIDVSKYLELYAGDANTLVFIGRPGCQYCQKAEPIVKKLAKDYDLEINYLNVDNFKDDDEEKFFASNEILQDNFGTPLFVSIANSKIIDQVDGLTDTAHYKDFLQRNNYIQQ